MKGKFALVSVLLIVLVIGVGTGVFYSKIQVNQTLVTCENPHPISNLPGQDAALVSAIRANSTFLSMEKNRNYSFYSVAEDEASYTNGSRLVISTVFIFECNGDGIAVVVNPENSILQLYYIALAGNNETITRA